VYIHGVVINFLTLITLIRYAYMHGELASRAARVFGFVPLVHIYAFEIFLLVSVLELAGQPRALYVRNQASDFKHLLPPADAPTTSSCTHYGNTCM
jgi:hypothetical protein